MTGEELIENFRRWYGPEKGLKVYMTVMPGILADFEKMLSARPGERLLEEYRLEDRRGTVIVSGRKEPGKTMEIDFACRPKA